MATNINAYLNFDGNCRQAMNFYKECLGGELFLQTVGESPMSGKLPEALNDSVMHSSLTSGSLVIMGSDMHHEKLVNGNTVHLCVNCSSEEEVNNFFNKLSAGGKVTEPLQETFWGAFFGALADKFGIHWMFNYDKNQAPKSKA